MNKIDRRNKIKSFEEIGWTDPTSTTSQKKTQ